MSTNSQQKTLESRGYRFSGYYSGSKVAAKEVATQYRKDGYLATVLTKSYAGRVDTINGYTVYIKAKENPNGRQ